MGLMRSPRARAVFAWTTCPVSAVWENGGSSFTKATKRSLRARGGSAEDARELQKGRHPRAVVVGPGAAQDRVVVRTDQQDLLGTLVTRLLRHNVPHRLAAG